MKAWEIWKAHDEGKTLERMDSNGSWKKVSPLDYCHHTINQPHKFRIKPETKKLWSVVCNETGLIVYSSFDKLKAEVYYGKYCHASSCEHYTYSLEEYIQVV